MTNRLVSLSVRFPRPIPALAPGVTVLFYSPRARDFFMNPEVSHNFSDRLWAAVGGNILGGPSSSFFGQLGRSDDAYLSARYGF